MLKTIKKYFSTFVYWSPLEEELRGYQDIFKGRILNAGSGRRDLSGFFDVEVYSQDLIPVGNVTNQQRHFVSSLHQIPVANDYFDGILCNAVLEHVENPEAVMAEFNRVIKKEGLLLLTIPFMQPEHLDPADYQRYTRQGLERLVQQHGFEVLRMEGEHSVYQTLGWMIQVWLSESKMTFGKILLRIILAPIFYYQCRHSKDYCEKTASAYRVLAKKT